MANLTSAEKALGKYAYYLSAMRGKGRGAISSSAIEKRAASSNPAMGVEKAVHEVSHDGRPQCVRWGKGKELIWIPGADVPDKNIHCAGCIFDCNETSCRAEIPRSRGNLK